MANQEHLNPSDIRRRVGARIRELRTAAGMTNRDLVAEMNARSHRWTEEIVSAIQTGRDRNLHLDELVSLRDVFGVTTDSIVVGALATPPTPRKSSRKSRRPEPTSWDIANAQADRLAATDHLPGFNVGPDQLEQLNATAKRAGVKRAALLREFVAVMLPVYNRWLDKQQ